MTRLDIESYCHDCPEICPVAKVIELPQIGAKTRHIVSIVCEHADRCRNMYEKIKTKEA